MSAPALTEEPQLQLQPLQEKKAALASALQALRHDGAQHLDPTRFHYMELLQSRASAASGKLQSILHGKLEAALADYRQRFIEAQATAANEAARLSSTHPDHVRTLRQHLKTGDFQGVRQLGVQAEFTGSHKPLNELNAYIHTATQPGEGNRDALIEMKGVRRFRAVWSKIVAAGQVEQAIGRGPKNAGPLNSHSLVLRSLALMRTLSPEYLQRFVSHVDSLLWLEQLNQQDTLVSAKPARKSRVKK